MEYTDGNKLINDAMLITVMVLLLLPVQALRRIHSSSLLSKTEIT